MSQSMVERTRRIDNGEPLILWHPPDDEPAAGYAVDTAICQNPDCPCNRIELHFRRVERLENGDLEARVPVLRAGVSSDGTDLTIHDAGTSHLTEVTTDWIREQLGQRKLRAWLRERWRRVRGQAGDPAYPAASPPEGVDTMVAFGEVFAYDFDLTVVNDRRLFLAEDQYCLNPDCTCDELAVTFIDLAGGSFVGHGRASIRRLGAPSTEGPPLVKRLWRALLDQYDGDQLRDRFARMRRVARERARATPRSRSQEVGRNTPCPCGSGKKYKRCCGA